MEESPFLLGIFVGTILLSVAVMLGIQVLAGYTGAQVDEAPGRTVVAADRVHAVPSLGEGSEGSGERTVKQRPGSSDLRRRREEDARLHAGL